jgi:hypothetical protein
LGENMRDAGSEDKRKEGARVIATRGWAGRMRGAAL